MQQRGPRQAGKQVHVDPECAEATSASRNAGQPSVLAHEAGDSLHVKDNLHVLIFTRSISSLPHRMGGSPWSSAELQQTAMPFIQPNAPASSPMRRPSATPSPNPFPTTYGCSRR